MSGRTVTLIILLSVGLLVYWMTRTGRTSLGGLLMAGVGVVLFADSAFAGPIPGDWETSGIIGAIFGVRMWLDGRRAACLTSDST